MFHHIKIAFQLFNFVFCVPCSYGLSFAHAESVFKVISLASSIITVMHGMAGIDYIGVKLSIQVVYYTVHVLFAVYCYRPGV